MSNITIFHNPRCSKSRETLKIIENKGISPDIVLYLNNPPDKKTLVSILLKLKIDAFDLLRKGEPEFKELNLADKSKSEDEILEAMIKFPKLIERPIVISENEAILGRPPENVLNLI